MKRKGQRAPSLQNDIKIEDSQFQSIQKIKHDSSDSKISGINKQSLQRQSQANWQIHHRENDNKSVSNMTSKSKREPTEKDLCKAILCLRKKYPQRSIEQIVIRLYQAACMKKDYQGSSLGSRQNDMLSEFQRVNDFEDGQIFFNHSQEEFGQLKRGSSKNEKVDEQLQQKSINSKKTTAEQIDNNIKLKQIQQVFHSNQPIHDNMIPEAGVNYIYKPKGRQVVVQFKQKDILKKKFINIQQQTRYNDRRVMAKSFIQRGYGVGQCRKQIEAQGVFVQMQRNTYKTLAGSVIILAFRKLESFIANECSKTIKFLDRWQMRAICTNLLNCRVNMEPELITTLFKFIKAGYGFGDIAIGEIQAVKLYLACQKYIYGKYVTMQFLQRLGEVQHKKNIELTLDYLNRKKARREQRLVKLRKRRLQTRVQDTEAQQQRQTKDREVNEDTLPTLSQIKIQDRQYTETFLQKLQDMMYESQKSNMPSLQPTVAQKQNKTKAPSQAYSELSRGISDVKQQQQNETSLMDQEMAYLYLKLANLEDCKNAIAQKYAEISSWDQAKFGKRFQKVMKRSIKKVQEESQIIGDPNFPVLNKLQKNEIVKIVRSPFGEMVRKELMKYFLLEQPNLNQLRAAVTITNRFLNQFKLERKEKESSQNFKRKTLENVQHSIKYTKLSQSSPSMKNQPRKQRHENTSNAFSKQFTDQQLLKIEQSSYQVRSTNSCLAKQMINKKKA